MALGKKKDKKSGKSAAKAESKLNQSVKKPSFLQKDVNFKELSLTKKKNQAIPSKETMNLLVREKTQNSPSRVLPLAVFLIILVLVFCKFAVFDRLSALNDAESQLSESKTMLNAYEKELKNYPQVKEEYYRYTDEFKTEQEAALADRVEILNLLSDTSAGLGQVTSFNVSGNKVSAVVHTANLDQVSVIRQRLEGYNWVKNVAVYSANKKTENSISVNSSFVFEVEKAINPEAYAKEPKPSDNNGDSNNVEDTAASKAYQAMLGAAKGEDSDYDNTSGKGGE